MATGGATGGDGENRQRSRQDHSGTTPRLYFVILWTVLSTFNFGFGTSELNPLQHVLSCPTVRVDSSSKSLSSCIDLTSTQFGYITAAFTIGGFLASLTLSPLKSRFSTLRQSKNVLLLAAVWNILGGLVQMIASSWHVLGLGRFLMGLGSGIAVAVVPSYLNDISPPRLKGSIGVINQLSIVIGILSAQALGVSPLASSPSLFKRGFLFDQAPWRFVPLTSASFPLIQILLSPFALNPPSDLEGEERERVARQLWGSASSAATSEGGESEALLGEGEADADTNSETASSNSSSTPADSNKEALSISELLKVVFRPRMSLSNRHFSPKEYSDIRKGTLLIIFTQMAQQLSGVNGVLYFSTGILSDVFKNGNESKGGDQIAKFIGLGITFVNVLMTFPPIPLIRETLLGRRKLLQISSSSMAISALVLSVALLTSQSILAAISIVVFVAGFSLGLGPIPFLILPELVPKRAIPAAASLGLSLNWLSNISVASLFLPLKNTFAQIDDSNGGSIFLLFVLINTLTFTGVTRYYSYK